MRKFLIALTLLCLSAIAAPAQIVPPSAFEKKAIASTGVIYVDGHQWCSGWVNRRVASFTWTSNAYEFVTARHCVQGTHKIEIAFSLAPKAKRYTVANRSIRVSQVADVARMVFYAREGEWVPMPVPIGTEVFLKPGDPLVNAAYPGGYGKLFQRGFLNSLEPWGVYGAFNFVFKWDSVIPVDLFSAPGSSGSPIFDPRGKHVVGIIVGVSYAEGGEQTLAIPGSVIRRFLNNPRDRDSLDWYNRDVSQFRDE